MQIFCIAILCEIPRWYRDIVAEFHSPFAGSAPSCSSSELARILTTSLSSFLLLHYSCSRDGSSRPVCSTSSYTAQHFVHMCNWSLSESQYCSTAISLRQVNATILSCCEVCDDIVGHDHTIWALNQTNWLGPEVFMYVDVISYFWWVIIGWVLTYQWLL